MPIFRHALVNWSSVKASLYRRQGSSDFAIPDFDNASPPFGEVSDFVAYLLIISSKLCKFFRCIATYTCL